MALTVTDTLITSDEVADHAEFRRHRAADGSGAWVCSGPVLGPRYGAQLFDHNQAITAMSIAEELARLVPNPDLIRVWERELSPNW